MKPRILFAAVVLAMSAAGCSSSGASPAVRDRRVCGAFEKFYDTGYNGTVTPRLQAAKNAALAAVRGGHDQALGKAVRTYVTGELRIPSFETLQTMPHAALTKLVPPDFNAAVPTIYAKCDALGRSING